jgi:hypothetical protein
MRDSRRTIDSPASHRPARTSTLRRKDAPQRAWLFPEAGGCIPRLLLADSKPDFGETFLRPTLKICRGFHFYTLAAVGEVNSIPFNTGLICNT